MIQKTGQLNPYIVTDNEQYKELVDLYNAWEADVAFKSNVNWINTNENWKKMHEYCEAHPDILKAFWIEMYQTFGEVGHFTYMLHFVFPDMIEPQGYCPLSVIEKLWATVLIALNQQEENR